MERGINDAAEKMYLILKNFILPQKYFFV